MVTERARFIGSVTTKRRSRPAPWGADELAARQAIVELVNAHPELWPELNRLTLAGEYVQGFRIGVNWCATLRLLQGQLMAADRRLRFAKAAE